MSTTDEISVGEMAEAINDSLTNLTKLITAASYVAGFAFSIGAILKFKQHKENPTQVPIGTPISMVFIAAALMFMPSIVEKRDGYDSTNPS